MIQMVRPSRRGDLSASAEGGETLFPDLPGILEWLSGFGPLDINVSVSGAGSVYTLPLPNHHSDSRARDRDFPYAPPPKPDTADVAWPLTYSGMWASESRAPQDPGALLRFFAMRRVIQILCYPSQIIVKIEGTIPPGPGGGNKALVGLGFMATPGGFKLDPSGTWIGGTPADLRTLYGVTPWTPRAESQADADTLILPIYALIKANGGMRISEMAETTLKVRRSQTEDPAWFDLWYGPGAHAFLQGTLAALRSTDRGLLMLHGPPGGGKTTVIRVLGALLRETHHTVVVSRDAVADLSGPSLLPLFAEHGQEYGAKILLVVEDAEDMVTTSARSQNPAVSNLLNVSDGILGDALRLQIVLTWNAEVKPDAALGRKGRLLGAHRFDGLPLANATVIAQQLGVDLAAVQSRPVMLADIVGAPPVEELSSPPRPVGLR